MNTTWIHLLALLATRWDFLVPLFQSCGEFTTSELSLDCKPAGASYKNMFLFKVQTYIVNGRYARFALFLVKYTREKQRGIPLLLTETLSPPSKILDFSFVMFDFAILNTGINFLTILLKIWNLYLTIWKTCTDICWLVKYFCNGLKQNVLSLRDGLNQCSKTTILIQ